MIHHRVSPHHSQQLARQKHWIQAKTMRLILPLDSHLYLLRRMLSEQHPDYP